jgi:hypothetical protein
VAFTTDDTALAVAGTNTLTLGGFTPNSTYAHSADGTAGVGNKMSTGTGGSLAFTAVSVWTNYQGYGGQWPLLRYAN